MVKVENKTTFNINCVLCPDHKDDCIIWEKSSFLETPVPLTLVLETIAILQMMMLRKCVILLLKDFFLLIVAKY